VSFSPRKDCADHVLLRILCELFLNSSVLTCSLSRLRPQRPVGRLARRGTCSAPRASADSRTREEKIMNIDKVMTRDVCACAPSDTLNRAAQIMWEADCGVLPVVDEQRRVVGVVTDRDICMASYTQGVPLWGASVSTAMSKELFTCSPEDAVGDVERLMKEKQIRRVPVVGGSGELLGIATLGDLARCSQSSRLQKAVGGLAITKTLAAICEPRAPQQAAAAE
jgi:CBS domain-containing protein